MAKKPRPYQEGHVKARPCTRLPKRVVLDVLGQFIPQDRDKHVEEDSPVLFFLSTEMHGRPEERNWNWSLPIYERKYVVYIHHGAVLLPVLLSVLFHLLFHYGVTPAIMWVS